jgi:hypothetical protein
MEDASGRDRDRRATSAQVGHVDQGQMGMGVDEARNDGEATEIQLLAGRRSPTDLGDPLTVKNDHTFPDRVGTGPVDHAGAPQHKALHVRRGYFCSLG